MKLKHRIIIILLLVGISISAQTTKDSIVALVPHGTEVYRHGYMELNQADRAMYDSILGSLLRFDDNNYSPYYYHRCDLPIVPTNYSIYDLMNDLSRMYKDIPELFILSSTIPRQDYGTGMYYARIGYGNTPENYLLNLQQMKAAYQEVADSVTPGMTEYQKLKIIHDAYCRRTTYGDMTGADASTAKGALVNKRAVCEGLSRGFLYLCQQAGLKCIYISGMLLTSSATGTWGNHAWNYVQVDGKWYLMDITADCGLVGMGVGYEGFLRGQDYMSINYQLVNSDGGDPNCNGVYQALPQIEPTTYNPNTQPPVTSIDQASSQHSRTATKELRDGRIVITAGDRSYDALGRAL